MSADIKATNPLGGELRKQCSLEVEVVQKDHSNLARRMIEVEVVPEGEGKQVLSPSSSCLRNDIFKNS